MTYEEVKNLYSIYKRAWETKDADLIITAFNDESSYFEPKEPENIGLAAIKEYWINKVVKGQDNIHFELKNVWIDGDTGIAEYHISFDDIFRKLHLEMIEIGIFTIKDGKFSSLREYYKSTKTPIL